MIASNISGYFVFLFKNEYNKNRYLIDVNIFYNVL